MLRTFARLDDFEPRREGALQAYLRQAILNRIRDELRRAGSRTLSIELDPHSPDPRASPFEHAVPIYRARSSASSIARSRPSQPLDSTASYLWKRPLPRFRRLRSHRALVCTRSPCRIVAAAALIAVAILAVQRAVAPPVTSGMVIRRVSADAPIDGTTGLSSDGRYVSHVDWVGTGNLVLTDLTTGKTRPLTKNASWFESDEAAEFSAFSPDDRQIAYVWRTTAGGYDLRVVDADGSHPRVLYHDEETVYIPFVERSPDGKSLLIILNRWDDTRQMALLPIAGGRPRVIKTFDGRSPGMVRFSPDGRYVAFDVPGQEGAPEHDILALAVDLSREVPLVQHPANDVVLGWMPDGQRLLFGSDRSGTNGAWSVVVADGRPVAPPELFRPDLGSGWPIRVTPSSSYYYGVPVARPPARSPWSTAMIRRRSDRSVCVGIACVLSAWT